MTDIYSTARVVDYMPELAQMKRTIVIGKGDELLVVRTTRFHGLDAAQVAKDVQIRLKSHKAMVDALKLCAADYEGMNDTQISRKFGGVSHVLRARAIRDALKQAGVTP